MCCASHTRSKVKASCETQPTVLASSFSAGRGNLLHPLSMLFVEKCVGVALSHLKTDMKK